MGITFPKIGIIKNNSMQKKMFEICKIESYCNIQLVKTTIVLKYVVCICITVQVRKTT